jgi:rhodanese-related sulfurtransferase
LVRQVIHREVRRLLASGAQIVDVLPSHEFSAAHIKGAIHLPLRRVLADAPAKLDRSRPVIVYCRDSL